MLLLLVTIRMMAVSILAVEVADTLSKEKQVLKKMGKTVKKTIRGFDRLEDYYIEPQHYEFSVMMQATRNYEDFILSSNGQSIMFSPDQRIKVGPYFGWRWVFLGTTFDLKNISLFGNSAKREIDFSIFRLKACISSGVSNEKSHGYQSIIWSMNLGTENFLATSDSSRAFIK